MFYYAKITVSKEFWGILREIRSAVSSSKKPSISCLWEFLGGSLDWGLEDRRRKLGDSLR